MEVPAKSILEYSGFKPAVKKVPVVKRHHYYVKALSVGGDAPKDVIAFVLMTKCFGRALAPKFSYSPIVYEWGVSPGILA